MTLSPTRPLVRLTPPLEVREWRGLYEFRRLEDKTPSVLSRLDSLLLLDLGRLRQVSGRSHRVTRLRSLTE